MRVVHIFKDYYPPTTGGIEQHMQLLCASLARQMDVSVLVPSRSWRRVEEVLDGVRVVRVPEFGRYASAPLCPTASLELLRMRPDVVHVHFPNPMGDLAYLLSATRAPLVITYHADIIKQRALLKYYRPVLGALFRRASRIIASSSEYVASSEFLGTYADRTVVIPYGVNASAFTLRGTEPAEAERLKAARGPFVLFVGALRYYKGLDVLIRAMAAVRARLIIAGRGPTGALATLVRELRLGDRVEFAGEVSDSRLRVLFHASTVVTLPSIDNCEAFGISLLEAMACGKPIVTTDLDTGIRFVNQDGVNGLRVPPREPDALAAALGRLIADPALCEQLGARGRRRVQHELSADQMVRRTVEVYRDVMRGNAPAFAPQSSSAPFASR